MCSYRFIEYYTNQPYKLEINEKIVQLTKEGLGIRSTARILEISATTLLKESSQLPQALLSQVSVETKLIKLMSCALILGIRKITSGWFMLCKRILKQL